MKLKDPKAIAGKTESSLLEKLLYKIYPPYILQIKLYTGEMDYKNNTVDNMVDYREA